MQSTNNQEDNAGELAPVRRIDKLSECKCNDGDCIECRYINYHQCVYLFHDNYKTYLRVKDEFRYNT